MIPPLANNAQGNTLVMACDMAPETEMKLHCQGPDADPPERFLQESKAAVQSAPEGLLVLPGSWLFV
jgi:hypothetical protein